MGHMGRVLSYLRLVRAPNLFTALADIGAGFLIVQAQFSGTLSWWPLLPLSIASACLYLSGMAFNDVADHEEDARVRPGRPLPAGAVSLRGAAGCGAGLMALGLAAAALFGTVSLCLALFLAASILLYDFGAKRVPVAGPLVLGFCRFFNLQLGMSAQLDFAANLANPAFAASLHAPALAAGAYAAGLTVWSAQEEAGRRGRSIYAGWILVGGALALAGWTAPHLWVWLPLGLLGALLLQRTIGLYRGGTPEAARGLVKTGVWGICLLDAGLILGHAGLDAWPFALTVALLVLPTAFLARLLAQWEA